MDEQLLASAPGVGGGSGGWDMRKQQRFSKDYIYLFFFKTYRATGVADMQERLGRASPYHGALSADATLR
jgi:hypothetical protein